MSWPRVVADILTAKDKIYDHQGELQSIALKALIGSIVLLYIVGRVPAAFADPAGIVLGPEESDELISLIELSIGPLFGFAMATPQWVRAEEAARGIREVLDALDSHMTAPPAPTPSSAPLDFKRLPLRSAQFSYTGGNVFCVGPVDLTVDRGELVFFTGGNGSGKTTLMKTLLGVYPLEHGSIEGERVCADTLAGYQALFTAILSRQHILRRLYGLAETAPPERVNALHERFGIAEIVRFSDGAFDRLDLSTGQRMRLAMVVALLEERPVCLFDEWTANQDPESTRYYYDPLLPELVAAGKTVLAVSHDDRIFDRADRVIALVGGQVVDSGAAQTGQRLPLTD